MSLRIHISLFLLMKGKLDYVVWSQEAESEITVTYPEKKN